MRAGRPKCRRRGHAPRPLPEPAGRSCSGAAVRAVRARASAPRSGSAARVGLGRGAVGHRYAHQPPSPPGGAAHPAGAVALDGGDDAIGPLVVTEADQHLVEHHLVGDGDPVQGAQALGEAPGQLAAALDEQGHAPTAQLGQRGPGREPPGPPGRLGHEVGGGPHRPAPVPDQVGGGEGHRGRVGPGVGAEHVAGVVGHVQPLVAVGGPRVGLLDPRGQMPGRGARRGPEPEGAVDVDPRPVLVSGLAGQGQVVAGARVHVHGLHANDGGPGRSRVQGPHQHGRVDGAVRAGGHLLHRPRAQSQEAQGTVDGGVPLRAGQDPYRRRTGQAPRFHVPSHAGQHVVAGRGQPDGVGRLPTGHEPEGRRPRQAQDLLQPPARHLLGHRGGRGCHRVEGGLVPARREQIRAHGRRRRAPDDEAEVAGPGRRHQPRLGRGHEPLDHVGGGGALLAQPKGKGGPQAVGIDGRAHRPITDLVPISGDPLGRLGHQLLELHASRMPRRR